MRALIEQIFVDGFAGTPVDGIGLAAMDDGAAIRLGDRWLVITTDSHVVHPIFFPGGDIGRLAVAGTVNDLAMMGATEVMALTCSVIIEEGFARSDLERIQASLAATCREAGAAIVTGDTKVMGKGELDGIVLNTTGIGLTTQVISDSGLKPGDLIIVTGTMGDHGMAVMAARHELELEGELRSDVAPLNGLIRAAIEAAGDGIISAMKDPTRGGLASTLNEMASKSRVGIGIEENKVPVTSATRSAADLLGIDVSARCQRRKSRARSETAGRGTRSRGPAIASARARCGDYRRLHRGESGLRHPRYRLRPPTSHRAGGRASAAHMLNRG